MKHSHTWAALLLLALATALISLPSNVATARPGALAARALPGDSIDATDFDPVWKIFQEAMKKNDRKKVADMTSFPFHSSDLASMLQGLIGVGHGPSFTREEFLKFYDRLFDKDVQRTIITTPSAMPMFDDKNNVDRYIVSISRDTKGFQWIEFRRDSTTGAWMLVRMDSISY